MKISLEWLKEYVDYQGTVDELDELFTNVGFPVEEKEQVGEDWMLDVEVTSNRPDCLGHIGLAREVAAVTGAALKWPSVEFTESGKHVGDMTSVVIEDEDLCSRYTARVISDITTGPSPDWMRRRLETIGIRSISNVVDITNYILMEIGQPLHSFDYDQLEGGRIIVRRAQAGEQMEMIDHTKIELKNDMLAIADADRPAALAGVMGGLQSEVSDATKNVLLESAHFNPLSIRRTARALTMGSESSFRFERDVDIEMVEWASRRAAYLLQELAGGTVAPGIVDVGSGRWDHPEVTMRLSRQNKLVGIEIDPEKVIQIFEGLDLQPKRDADAITCRIPSWRKDLVREVDLIEEVVRISGFDQVPTDERIHISVTTEDDNQRTRRLIRSALCGCGFYETIGVSFIEDRYWKWFAKEGFEPVRVQDFSRKSNNALRSSLLPSLLSARKRNQDAGNPRCDLFELAAVHHPGAEKGALPIETMQVAVMTDGDFQELRGVIEAVLSKLNRTVGLTCRPAEVLWAADGAGAELIVGEKRIGWAGKASDAIIDAFVLNQGVCLAEIDFNVLMNLKGAAPTLEPLLRYPAITRDLSLVLDEEITWARIEDVIHEQNVSDLRQLNFTDIYRGKGIEKGKKSLTLSMEFRNPDRTLRHEDVDACQDVVVNALSEKLNATLRSIG